MIDVETWAEIRRLHFSEKMPIKQIVRSTGFARNTVREAIRSTEPPAYERPTTGSAVDVVEADVRRLLLLCPTMPTTVIAEHINWQRGMTILKDRVREIRPEYLPADPAGRTSYEPGELAQWDLWFPDVDVPLEDGVARSLAPPVLVGNSGYSRYLVAEMIPTRQAFDILCGQWRLLQRMGAVPHKGIYDGEAALSTRRGREVKLTDEFQAFRGTLGMGVVILKPRDPESKGIVERHNGYFETSFLPGRTFSGPVDFNMQLQDWLDNRANVRTHQTLRERPVDRLPVDRAAMMTLPPVAPDPSWKHRVRLARDHWVRVDTCDYSVHPRAIGRNVDITADLERVTVKLNGDVVASHARSWARHRTVTNPAHVAAADQLRAEHGAAKRRGKDANDTNVEVRDLSSYDELTEAS